MARWAPTVGLVYIAFLPLARAETNRVILEEDFESYGDTISMRTFWTSGTGQLVTDAPGGGQAVSHDGGDMNRHGGFVLVPDATHNIVLSADFYDFATNIDKRVTISLRNTNGESVDLGFQGTSCYVARVMGFGTSTNWVPFKKSQPAVEGWHRFRAVLSSTNVYATLELKRDGKVDRHLDLLLAACPLPLTQLRFGGLSGRPSRGGPVLLDNLKLEIVAVEPTPDSPAGIAQNPAVASGPPATPGRTLPVISPPDLSRAQAQSPVPAAPAPRSAPANQPAPTAAAMWWIFGALAVIIVLLVGLLLMFRRGPASGPLALIEASRNALPSGVDGQRPPRAIGSEVAAVPHTQLGVEEAGSELTEFAKQALVQGLYSQRNALLETQRRAKNALVELEDRLAELRLPLQERIQAYERRITELERALDDRGDEMRELTRATLSLVRQKLDQERERSGPRLN